MLDRAGRLTPGGLRAALARAVIEVAPEKARLRRETAARFARVERWAEDSGNAALMGRELPPDEVLACDQRICWWAGELRKAGLDGGMDELRARAFLDLVLGKDSRPRPARPPARTPTAAPARTPAAVLARMPVTVPARVPAAGAAGSRRGQAGRGATGGFAGQVTLTVPLATAAGLAGPARRAGRARPGRPVAGPGPGRAAAPEPGHDVVRDRDRPARARRRARLRPARTHGKQESAPARGRRRAGPGSPSPRPGRDGPPGGYGTWRLRTPGPGPGLIVAIGTLDTDPCEHQHQARGHDPGARLRHLSQVRHATCTSPACRGPASQCDFEHNTPYKAGGRTCLCNGGPKCRHDHRLKQHPGWKVDQLPDGTFRWTTPSGRSYDTEPTRYPI